MPYALLSLLACGPTKVALRDIESADDVEEACEKYEEYVVEEEIDVVFLETTEACPWGEGDNLDMAQTVVTARVEQTESLSIDDAVVCDMELDLDGLVPGEIQVMVYDDYFFFTFDDVVLASSIAPAVEALDTEEGQPIYDWSKVAGTPFPTGDAPFCLGDGDCEIPSTETEGPISLSFDRDVVNQLSARAVAQERLEFGFVTTGDNDPEIDCKHAVFGFTVTVRYLAAR
jgi:hypothetical protein